MKKTERKMKGFFMVNALKRCYPTADTPAFKTIVHLFVGRSVNFFGRRRRVSNLCRRTRYRRSRQIAATGNQPCAAFVGEIRPRPVDKHEDAITEPDEEENVYEKPRQPSDESGNMNLPELRDRCGSANGGETAFVPVVEKWAG